MPSIPQGQSRLLNYDDNDDDDYDDDGDDNTMMAILKILTTK